MTNSAMSNSLISHIGIAVADLEQAISRYKILTGDEAPMVCEVPEQKVKVAIFKQTGAEPHGGGNIELVAATSDDSPVTRFIKRKGEGLHHVCLYVDDLDVKLSELRRAGVRLIDETPRIGAEGDRIAFVHPSGCNGVLVELQEKTKES